MKRKRIALGAAVLAAAAAIAAAVALGRGRAGEEATETLHPSRGSIRSTITTTGTVEPQNRLELKPPIGGRIDQILVREGDRVRIGQTLAWMSSTERAALLDAARSHGKDAVAYWSDVYKPTPLISPIDGEVIVRPVEPGQTVTATEPVLVLSDRLIVTAQVDETDIGKVKAGQKAVVSLDAYPQVKTPARVAHIDYESKIVNNVTIYEVDIIPDTLPEVFRSGMSAVVEIVEGSRNDVLRVPVDAVTRGRGGATVLVREGKRTETRKVALGVSDDRYVEVVSGLRAEDTIVMKRMKKVQPKSAAGTNPFLPFGGRRR